MSKKRPTEVSWDSDDDLLQDDISGINAFPHTKKEETEEELDEDALLGSDDDATGKELDTSEVDMSDSANVDRSATSDAANTTFGVPETDDYEFADVSQEFEEDVLVIEPEVDASLLNDTQEEHDLLEEGFDYSTQDVEEDVDDRSELDSRADTQPGLDNTEDGVDVDERGGSSSESESNEEEGRSRFKSERAAIVSLSQSKSRTDIPDTLEISEEQQATIDEFLTKDGRKKKQRRGRGHPQQRQPFSGSPGLSHQPSRYPPTHLMHSAQRAEFTPHQQTKLRPPLMSGPHIPNFVDTSSGPSRPRKILINPHFRGPSTSSAAPDTTVTWSHQTSHQIHPPQLPQVSNPPSFPAPVRQATYPSREQQQPYNGQMQHALLAFPEQRRVSEPPRSHEHHIGHEALRSHEHRIGHEPLRGHERHMGHEPLRGLEHHMRHEPLRGHEHHTGHEPHRGQVPLFAMSSQPGLSQHQGAPQQQAFTSGPTQPFHERHPPGHNSQGPRIGLSQPGYSQHRPMAQQYDQSLALSARGLAPGRMQPLLGNSPHGGVGCVPLGVPPHQLCSDPGLLNAPPRQDFMAAHPSSQRRDPQPFYSSSTNPGYTPGQMASGIPNQPGSIGSHSQRMPYQANNHFHSPHRQQQHTANMNRDPAIEFGLLPPRQSVSSSHIQSGGHSLQLTGPRSFPRPQQQQQQVSMAIRFQQAPMQNRGKRFPRGQMGQPLQRRSQPGLVPQGQTNNNNITLVNAAPQKRLSGEVTTGASPPKVSRNAERKNVKDRLQLPSQQKQTDIQPQQQKQQATKPSSPGKPKEPEEPMDEETRLLNQKIEEQKRLRAEIIKRKEARRLQQAKQRRLELQKKLAEQGMTLSDVEASSDNSSTQKQPQGQPDAQQHQQQAPQKTFVPTEMAASKTGQAIAAKRQVGTIGTVQTVPKEPPCKVPRQMSQMSQLGQGQITTQPNRSGPQPDTHARFSRQNSRGQRGSFVRGLRGVRRGGLTRQISGGNTSQTQMAPSQLQARQIKLEQSAQALENQTNRSVVTVGEQDYSGQGQGHAVKGQGPFRGRSQMNRGQFGNVQLPLRGRGQTVSPRQGHAIRRGLGQRQASGGQGERTVVARSMSGNNIVLGGGQVTQLDASVNRRVVVGPHVAKGNSSQFVSIDNLSKSTTQQKLYKLCRTVGPVENVQLLQSQNKAIIKFHNPSHGHMFAQKYDRHLLDLSSIRISTLPS